MNQEDLVKEIDMVENYIGGIFYYLSQQDKTFDPVVDDLYKKYDQLSIKTRGELGLPETLNRLKDILRKYKDRALELGAKPEELEDAKLLGYNLIFDAEIKQDSNELLPPERKMINSIFKKPGIH